MKILIKIALALLIIGAINWGLVALFDFNLVSFLFGETSIIAKMTYVIIALAGILCLSEYIPRRENED